jgi:hypothetical protein
MAFHRRGFIKAVYAVPAVALGTKKLAASNGTQQSQSARAGGTQPASEERTRGERIIEPARAVPVAEKVDVLVAGGGPSGVSAAVAAARAGASVALIERNGCLGGNGTAGLMGYFGGTDNDHVQGLVKEIHERLRNENGMRRVQVENNGIFFDVEAMKYVVLQMMEENGVKLRLYTLAAKPIMEGHVVKGAFLESKSGRQAILAKMVVDATGDADLAAASGAPCEKGRESDRKTRPMALLFRIGNIDYPKLAKYVAENPDDVHPSARAGMLDLKNQVIRIFGFQETCIKAHKNGDLDPDLHYIRFEGMTRASTAILNTTRMYDVDGSKAEDLTKATVIGYKQIRQLLNVMRKYIPGLENIELIEVAPNMGVRESRRIVGEYVYQIEDVSRSTRFPDTLCTTYRQGTPGTEQHSPDGGEGKRRERGPESPPPPPPPPTPRIRTPLNRYHIPYRCLLPQKVENLLVPGRAMSASHLAGVWFRGMPNCVMTGQIAGVSAAVAARLGAVARKVDIAQVQNTLRKQGIRIE